NVARARFDLPGAAVAEVVASVGDGIHMKGQSATAPGAQRTITVETGKPLTVSSAVVGETGTGFHVDVACWSEISEIASHDRSLGRVDNHYDNGRSHWVR